jgi:hypothetical protein
MKWNILAFSLCLAFPTFAQTFKLQSSANRVNYDVCQENHNRILNQFIKQVDSQIERMLNGISKERFSAPDFKLQYYKQILSELVVKRIFLKELSKQLNSKKMSQPGKPEFISGNQFLNPDAIKIDLEAQYQKNLEEIVNAKNIKVGKDFLKDLRNDLIKDAVKSLVSSRFRKIGAGIFARVVLGETGKIATGQVIKTATLHFGSELFVSVGTGLILDLLTFPLHAYRLPPETEWTDILDEHPETIIVPEWMKKAGVKDPPWLAHCCAIQRRTRHVEDALKQALESDESDFIASVREVFELSDVEEKEDKQLYQNYNYAPADNTYVYRPTVYRRSPGPSWLGKH